MPEVIITYENLYELLRRERNKPELQKIDDDFYVDVVKYLFEKSAILESQSKKDSIFASTEVQKTQTQLRNVQKILKELYEKRENKIIEFALYTSRSQNAQETSAMLPEEKALYNELRWVFDSYREGILMNLLKSKLPEIAVAEQKDLKIEEKTDTLAIRIIEDIPEFVGPDLKTYGPFRKESVQDMPKDIAALLVQTNQAKHENP